MKNDGKTKARKSATSPPDNLRRLQCLYEHCARNTGNGCDFALCPDGSVYLNRQTQKQFELWRSGYEQGVVDQAVRDGIVNL